MYMEFLCVGVAMVTVVVSSQCDSRKVALCVSSDPLSGWLLWVRVWRLLVDILYKHFLIFIYPKFNDQRSLVFATTK